jgi:hypothetical protein
MNRAQFLAVLILSVITCLVGSAISSRLFTFQVAQAQQSTPEQKGKATVTWEYRVMPVSDVRSGEQLLREMSIQGWELVAVQTNLAPRVHMIQGPASKPEAYYFFKRAK